MCWTPRPLPGESLDSWLAVVRREFKLTRTETLVAVGLSPGVRVDHASLELSSPQLEQVAQVTGLLLEEVRGMTLWRYLPCVWFAPWREDRRTPSTRWVRPVGASGCPRCWVLNGGRWRVMWRLGWVFMCVVHGCYLAGKSETGWLPAAGLPPTNQGARDSAAAVKLEGAATVPVEDGELIDLQYRLSAELLKPRDTSWVAGRCENRPPRALENLVYMSRAVAIAGGFEEQFVHGADPVVADRLATGFGPARAPVPYSPRKPHQFSISDPVAMAGLLRISWQVLRDPDPRKYADILWAHSSDHVVGRSVSQ